jgi:hypothetical protein
MARVLEGIQGAGHEVLHELVGVPVRGAVVDDVVPNGRDIVELAREAASTLAEVPLLGWDMAAVEGGALIVEPNFLTQLADRCSMLDARFNAFLAARRQVARRAKPQRRTAQCIEARERMRRLGRDMAGA